MSDPSAYDWRPQKKKTANNEHNYSLIVQPNCFRFLIFKKNCANEEEKACYCQHWCWYDYLSFYGLKFFIKYLIVSEVLPINSYKSQDLRDFYKNWSNCKYIIAYNGGQCREKIYRTYNKWDVSYGNEKGS